MSTNAAYARGSGNLRVGKYMAVLEDKRVTSECDCSMYGLSVGRVLVDAALRFVVYSKLDGGT
jgi:hypothetical protein